MWERTIGETVKDNWEKRRKRGKEEGEESKRQMNGEMVFLLAKK